MSQVKFQKLINDFSPASLAEVFRSHDFFRIKEDTLASFSNEQFTEFTQLGDFDLEDNTNIIVVCARSLTPLNERASRKNQYDLSKKVLKNFIKARAGVFVYYDNKGDFRMSLIYADYVGTKINYSTFRRFTYFVSKDQKNITFLQQVASLNFTNFKELKDLFSVEKVTKEFFKKYRDLFNEILEDFEKNTEFQNIVVNTGISTTPDFVKKLMGQIVFLYFVQKKGWLGVQPNKNWGEGDYSYLRTLFENCKKAGKNYFNDYLEPLFYEALAEKRGEDDFFEKLNCRVPFLNGGLFESVYDWKTTEINIHNEVLGKLLDFFDQYNFTVDENTPSDQEISVDPEMLGKIFEELLGVKDRKDKGAFYTPREIVHYMCRESLIQHLVSDNTAPEDRIRRLFDIKDTDLSLVVENEEKAKNIKDVKEISEKIDFSLRNVKIVDPAVGSGAFPMGMLNEISSVRHYLNTNFLHKTNDTGKELSLYDIKKETLENCIYAVDLEPGAVEIAKLRFWLALIVEFESNDPKIAPPVLPNLDYKIMQGNSLLEEYEGVKLFDEKIIQVIDTGKEKQVEDLKKKQSIIQKEYFDLHSKNKLTPIKKVELDAEAKKIHDQLRKLSHVEKNTTEESGLFDFCKHSESKLKADQLKSLQKQFFETNKKDKKESIKKQIEKIQWELIETTLREHNKVSELEKIQEFKKSRIKPFFLWKLHFADVFEQKGGFDIVIGNPPYVGEKGNKEIFRPIAKGNLKEFYQGKMDLFYFFFHLALNLGKQNSSIAYITTNYYTTALGARKLREDLKTRSIVEKLIDFNELKIFESAMGQHNMITILKKDRGNDYIARTCISKRKGVTTPEILNKIVGLEDEETDYFDVVQKDLYDGEENYIRLAGSSILSNDPVQKILEKILKTGEPLGSICHINNGIHSQADNLSLKKYEFRDDKSAEIGDGIYVLDSKNQSDSIILDKIKKSKNDNFFLRPFFKNSDISKYYTSHETSKEIIYLNKQINDIEKIPLIRTHLDRFKTIIKNGSDNAPYLHRPKTERNFISPKIVVPQRSPQNTFGYNEIPWYSSADVYFINEEDKSISLKYILALLNSKLYYVWLYYRGKRKGGMLELYQQPLSEIPIKRMPEQKTFIDLVDKVLSITKSEDYLTNTEKQADFKKLEHQIDELVYKLYDLTPKEIEIVENSSK